MCEETTALWLQKSGKARKFRCVLISVCDFGGKNESILIKNLFKTPERAGVDKIRPVDPLKIHLGVEVDPWDGKSSCEWETASFCSCFNTILRDKKQTDDQNQNILQKILLKSMPFWPQPQSDECHFLSLKLSMLCYALMNFIVPYTNDMLPLQFMQRAWDEVTLLQSSYFCSFIPMLLTLPPLTTGGLYSPYI